MESIRIFLHQFTSIKNMMPGRAIYYLFIMLYAVVLQGCDNSRTGEVGEERKTVIIPAERMDSHVKKEISSLLKSLREGTGNKLGDTVPLKFLNVLDYYYKETEQHPAWSSHEVWKPHTDSLIAYLDNCSVDGLFPEDYGLTALRALQQRPGIDSLEKNNPVFWAAADLIFTDAFFHLLQDLKQGRLQPDSVAWKYNKTKQQDFFATWFNRLLSGDSISRIAQALQPTLKDYVSLKNSLPSFLDSMDTKNYTYLRYPYKDSLLFLKSLLTRLKEEGIFHNKSMIVDSAALDHLLKRYQEKAGIKVTGKLSAFVVSSLNNNDREKHRRIAITLDKYKKLPERLPEKYIWVNLPSYRLQVWQQDSLMLESKVIIGKPGTPTPRISSQISDLVIFPTWTVPNSIIVKEILPGLKRNTGYLGRKGLALFNNDGDEVDPTGVNWSAYTKGIPYYVRQASGDNNALGVIKFNFKNPYAVYLHDTNQRYLFKNKMRSLSHGCVRVEDWKKLAFYIARNDSVARASSDTIAFTPDSITTWITRKERHVVPIKKQLPVFILYFGCEGAKGTVRFYDDVYGEDKVLREKYFAHK